MRLALPRALDDARGGVSDTCPRGTAEAGGAKCSLGPVGQIQSRPRARHAALEEKVHIRPAVVAAPGSREAMLVELARVAFAELSTVATTIRYLARGGFHLPPLIRASAGRLTAASHRL